MRVLALGLILISACGPGAEPRPPDPTGTVRPAEAPIQPLTLEGPFASLEEYCNQLEVRNRRAVTVARPIDDQGEVQDMSAKDREELAGADRLDCRLTYYYEEDDEAAGDEEEDEEEFFGFDLPVEGPAQANGSGALLEARIVPFGEGDVRCRVALRTGAGWYLQTAGVPCHAEDGSLVARTEALAIEDLLAGGEPELAWRYAARQTAGDGSPTRIIETETLVLCGVGDSGVPRCYEGVVVAGRSLASTGEQADGAATVEGTEIELSFQLQVQYGAGGIALIGDIANAGTIGADAADRIRRQLGRHPIEFP
jgi:hypothetical protein